ncbi:MAG: hypothetical protein Q4F63_06215 [Clostridia bacterium]|nr:hypothetical protein [Clostridia bacterium]
MNPKNSDIINKSMEDDIKGKEKTGFYPYYNKGEILFDQRWVLITGIKN